MAPVIACVVLTGTPVCVAMSSAIAAPVSAANPPTGCSFVIFDPIVWMMRQPPGQRPETDRGVRREDDPERDVERRRCSPPRTGSPAMIPIVFCASLAP